MKKKKEMVTNLREEKKWRRKGEDGRIYRKKQREYKKLCDIGRKKKKMGEKKVKEARRESESGRSLTGKGKEGRG